MPVVSNRVSKIELSQPGGPLPAGCQMVSKTMRDSPFAAASTWTFSTPTLCVAQDHPVDIPRRPGAVYRPACSELCGDIKQVSRGLVDVVRINTWPYWVLAAGARLDAPHPEDRQEFIGCRSPVHDSSIGYVEVAIAAKVEVGVSGGALVGAQAACVKGIPDITNRDPLSVWDCCAAGACAVNIRSVLGLGGENWTGEHKAWLVKLMNCQHFGCQAARSCCELALNPGQHDSSDQADEADWEQGQADCGTADSGGAEAHGQQASYDEKQGAVAPQDHVLPTRAIVSRSAGFGHAQQASRAVSYAISASTLGGTRTPDLPIRRSGQVVQDRPSPVMGWADIPQLSIPGRRRLAAWQQSPSANPGWNLNLSRSLPRITGIIDYRVEIQVRSCRCGVVEPPEGHAETRLARLQGL
jgi:hypothetical protein